MNEKTIEWLSNFDVMDFIIFSYTELIFVALWMQVLHSTIEFFKMKNALSQEEVYMRKCDLKILKSSIVLDVILALSFSTTVYVMLFGAANF